MREDLTACRARLEAEMHAAMSLEGVAFKSATSPSGQAVICQVVDLETMTDDIFILEEPGHNYIVSANGRISFHDQWLVNGRWTREEAIALMMKHPVCNGLEDFK